MTDVTCEFYFGVAAPCITALVLSNLMTSHFDLKKPERVTSSIECCYQNCGIATSVALAMFEGQEKLSCNLLLVVQSCSNVTQNNIKQ